MEIKILSQRYNPLLKRNEVIFEVEHKQTKGTPPRLHVREELARKLGVKMELVYIRKIETKTGAMTAIGEANVYDSVEQANFIEPKYIIARNTQLKEEEGEE